MFTLPNDTYKCRFSLYLAPGLDAPGGVASQRKSQNRCTSFAQLALKNCQSFSLTFLLYSASVFISVPEQSSSSGSHHIVKPEKQLAFKSKLTFLPHQWLLNNNA